MAQEVTSRWDWVCNVGVPMRVSGRGGGLLGLEGKVVGRKSSGKFGGDEAQWRKWQYVER